MLDQLQQMYLKLRGARLEKAMISTHTAASEVLSSLPEDESLIKLVVDKAHPPNARHARVLPDTHPTAVPFSCRHPETTSAGFVNHQVCSELLPRAMLDAHSHAIFHVLSRSTHLARAWRLYRNSRIKRLEQHPTVDHRVEQHITALRLHGMTLQAEQEHEEQRADARHLAPRQRDEATGDERVKVLPQSTGGAQCWKFRELKHSTQNFVGVCTPQNSL
jgi:hypothetical protein